MRSNTTVGERAVNRCRLPSLGERSHDGLAAVTVASHTTRARVAAAVEAEGDNDSTCSEPDNTLEHTCNSFRGARKAKIVSFRCSISTFYTVMSG